MAKKTVKSAGQNAAFSEFENEEINSFFEQNPNEQVCIKVDRCVFNLKERGAADSYAKTHGFRLTEVDRNGANLSTEEDGKEE
jgi:hypothetical protein